MQQRKRREKAPDDETKAERLDVDGVVWLTYHNRASGKKEKGCWHKLAVVDTETDPFDKSLPNLKIAPFCWGMKTIDDYWCDFQEFDHFKEQSSIMQSFIDLLASLEEPHLIYAHNGGKFDFTFLIPWIEELSLINGRISECRIGHHVLRDSFLMFPESLGRSGDKDKFDYRKMERARRNKHKAEILAYLRQDCHALLTSYVLEFIGEFGVHPTMPTAAWKQMLGVMRNGNPDFEIESMSEVIDKSTRKWYAGGRVECFENGILIAKDRFKVFDINGAYAGAMRNLEHPVGRIGLPGLSLDEPYDFATITAISDGALFLHYAEDIGMDDRGYLKPDMLLFPSGKHRFFATRHEIEAGLQMGRLKILKVHGTRYYEERSSFRPFIDHFTEQRNHAKAKMKELGFEHPEYKLWDIRNLFYKRVQNGTYGKTAQDPREWKDYIILKEEEPVPDGWSIDQVVNGYRFACQPSTVRDHSFYNVACGASITGAVRATLFRGICNSRRPVYCDTDSIICEDYAGEVDDAKLGAMKLEAAGDVLAIAGKKTYALGDTGQWTTDRAAAREASAKALKSKSVDGSIPWKGGYIPCVKFACKGVRITPAEIFVVAGGGQVISASETPTIKYSGAQYYESRTVRNTVHIEPRKRRVGL